MVNIVNVSVKRAVSIPCNMFKNQYVHLWWVGRRCRTKKDKKKESKKKDRLLLKDKWEIMFSLRRWKCVIARWNKEYFGRNECGVKDVPKKEECTNKVINYCQPLREKGPVCVKNNWINAGKLCCLTFTIEPVPYKINIMPNKKRKKVISF